MESGQKEPASWVTRRLNDLKSKDLFRQGKIIESAQGRCVVVNGRQLINFCSNDYLGLANDPRLIQSFKRAADKYGVGSGASSLVCGRSRAHVELEETVQSLTGRDKAVLFSSGYMANMAIVSALAQRGDIIVEDKLNHASMIDAALLSRARLLRYAHCDALALDRIISKNGLPKKLVLTDAVFSMDGDMAPLKQIAESCTENDACLSVDDSHGFGVFGHSGKGLLEHMDLQQSDVPIMMATFGKAIGCAGAFVAGPEELIELLVQTARPYIYSTALAPALAEVAHFGLSLLEVDAWRREYLFGLIRRFRDGAKQAGLVIQDSISPIQPLIVGSAKRAVKLSDALLEKGFLITPIRPPTVAANTSRLRITLSAGHNEKDIDDLLDALVCCDEGPESKKQAND